jgi:hypothetical protein
MAWSPSLVRSAFDDPVGYAPNSLDFDFHRVSVVQKHGWFPGGPDAVRSTRRDEVAGLERHRA